jgi:hypothetical protein
VRTDTSNIPADRSEASGFILFGVCVAVALAGKEKTNSKQMANENTVFFMARGSF